MRPRLQRLRDSRLARAVLGVYLFQGLILLLPVATIPYLSRVLSPTGWGLVLVGQSFALWVALVMEYGFNFSATREIAACRDDPDRTTACVARVLGAKTLLLATVVPLVALLGLAVPLFRDHPDHLAWALLLAIGTGLSPHWYFQGRERIVPALAVELAARAASTLAIFLLVRDGDDGALVLALHAAGAFGAAAIPFWWMYRDVPLRWPPLTEVRHALREGWSMFLFRGALSAYTTANTFILSFFATPAQVSYFGGAEKLARGLGQMFHPLSQVVYPRIASLVGRDRAGAARLARASLLGATAAGLALGALLFALAPFLVAVMMGPGYEEAVPVLRILALLVPVQAVVTVLGVQWMFALKLEAAYTRVILASAAVNLTLALALAPLLAHQGMAVAVLVAEALVATGLTAALLRRGLHPLRYAPPAGPGATPDAPRAPAPPPGGAA